MRFKRLKIPAFGPFTDLELTFTSQPDLHIIYGNNEAGKSSLLRAIRDLLFGIPAHSTDNFLHDYKNLRLVGEIENRAGELLSFQRRKGNKNTVLNAHGNPLPDTALRPFLGSVDLPYFSAMFGLGGHELRDGAIQLLKGEGELGHALFSASLGGTPIQRVLDALTAEAEKLFKGRATSNVSIRPKVNQHKELLKRSRDAFVSTETWEQVEEGLKQQNAERARLEEELSAIALDLAWIERCEDALPSVGRLNDETRALGELPALPHVGNDFVERARSARDAVRASTEKVTTHAGRIENLQSQLLKCETTPEVLSVATDLDVLHQDLGAYREQKKSLTKLRDKLAGLEPVLRSGMKSLGLEGELKRLETLRLTSAVQTGCEEAANELRKALESHLANRSKEEEVRKEIEDAENELTQLPEVDLTPLRESLQVAAEATDASKTLAASQAEVKKLLAKMQAAKALVPGLPEDQELALGLSVPGSVTIRKFQKRLEDLTRETDAVKKQITDEEAAVKILEAELRRLERRGPLPSEDSLQHARRHRDHGWELVLADWKGEGAKEELEAGIALEEAFPHAIAQADQIADQLRSEAEAVAQAEEKRLQVQNSKEKIEEAKATLISLQASVTDCQTSWEAEWAPTNVPVRSPEEMEEWRENWLQFREAADKLQEATVALGAKEAKTQNARKMLADALMDSPEKSFSVLYEAAKTKVQQGENSSGRREGTMDRLTKLKKVLVRLDKDEDGLRGALNAAEAKWRLRCTTVGFAEDTTSDAGLKLLQDRKELLSKFDVWSQLSGEAEAAEANIQTYEDRVAEKASALGIEGALIESQEAALWNALSKARTAQAEHDQLLSQIQGEEAALTAARQAETQALQTLEEVLRLSKLKHPDDLEPLIASLERRATHQDRLDSHRETLSGLARGQDVEEFIARVQAENPDELTQRKALLETRKKEKTLELEEVQAKLIELRNEKAELEEAGDEAASLRQQAESEAAAIRQDAARFLRLQLAAHFLRNQIEQFREENQGPLLKGSGQVFKEMTQGSFEGLAPEFTHDDVPVLAGYRADGTTVRVEGMSDGTRDQLYIALRLAAMDFYLREHEPMPLILDDLVMTFDNDRAKALLPQLANLAQRTQIFLFTHHEHVVELCRETLGNKQFRLHELKRQAAFAMA